MGEEQEGRRASSISNHPVWFARAADGYPRADRCRGAERSSHRTRVVTRDTGYGFVFVAGQGGRVDLSVVTTVTFLRVVFEAA